MRVAPRFRSLIVLLALLGAPGAVQARHPQVKQLLDDMRGARSALMKLSDQVRWPGDHTRRTFLHEREEDYTKAMEVVGRFREAHQAFLGLPMIYFLEDFEAMDEFKSLTRWARDTSVAMTLNWKPLDPPQRVERIVHHPGWLEEDD